MASGSFINNMMDGTRNSPTINVGDKATILGWTDRAPGIITEVLYTAAGKLKAVKVQEIHWKVDNWQSGYASEYYPDKPYGEPKEFKVVNRGKRKGTIPGLSIGDWDAYRDPTF